MVRWARDLAGWSVDDAAHVLGVSADRWRAWESGTSSPTMSQLRALADRIDQPVGVFFLPEPPRAPAPAVAFRRVSAAGAVSPALAMDVRRAIRHREIALDLLPDGGDVVATSSPLLSLRLRAGQDVASAGTELRDALGVSVTEQLQAPASHALGLWRRAVERAGVLVFETRSATVHDARGICIDERPLPLVVLNGKDAVTARAFTLLHECVHLALGEGAVCDGDDREIERFCDRVAAAALLPTESIRAEARRVRRDPTTQWSDAELRKLANRFGASAQATLLRLVALGLATQDEHDRRRASFRARRATSKDGAPPPHMLSLKYCGRLYPRIVLDALSRDAVTYTSAARYLGLSAKHLPQLERELVRHP